MQCEEIFSFEMNGREEAIYLRCDFCSESVTLSSGAICKTFVSNHY